MDVSKGSGRVVQMCGMGSSSDSLWMGYMTLLVAGGCVAIGILAIVWPRVLAFKISQFMSLLLVLAVFLIGLDELRDWSREAWGVALALGLQLALLLALCGTYFLVRSRPRLLRAAQVTGLLMGGGVALTGLMWQLEEPAPPPDRSHCIKVTDANKPADHEESAAQVAQAWTDRGTPIRLYECREPVPWMQAETTALEAEFANRVIRVAPPDSSHSCHGWTFAGGRYLIFSPCVEQILQENGYLEVGEPNLGDVIIYRDENGQIVHSGVVRLTDGQGLTVIESKWDMHGRYLHAPEVQPYSARFNYYRSPRMGHLLAGLEGPGADDAAEK